MTASFLYATLSSKIDNRLLCAIGLVLMGVAGFSFGFLNLEIATVNIAIPNFVYGLGMALAMVPIISLSVITLKNEQMTNAAGLQNLLKNVGGAVGTSIVTTMISRYSQMHQFSMVKFLHDLNPVYMERLSAMKGAFMQFTAPNIAEYMAQYSMYGQMMKQATLWGFIDAFRMFGILAFVIIPLVFLVSKEAKKKEKQKA